MCGYGESSDGGCGKPESDPIHVTPPPSQPTTGEKIVGYCGACPPFARPPYTSDERCGRCREIITQIDAALAEVQRERDEAVRAVFGFVHSEHCPLTHGPTGAKVQCLSCQREAAERREREAGAKLEALESDWQARWEILGRYISEVTQYHAAVLRDFPPIAAVRSGPATKPVLTYEEARGDVRHRFSSGGGDGTSPTACVMCGGSASDPEHLPVPPAPTVTDHGELIWVSAGRFTELEQREVKLRRALEIATTRLEILLGRARGCDSERPPDEPLHHGVTEIEVPGWIAEQRSILEETARRDDRRCRGLAGGVHDFVPCPGDACTRMGHSTAHPGLGCHHLTGDVEINGVLEHCDLSKER